jgi:ribosomal protein S18 acetylase RimI-like enzyme
MNIRSFRYSDLEALIDIARVSFAEEQIARGATPENFARQVRLVARGRFVPFKILTALAGYQWEIFVAELDGTVVGCASYLGGKKIELANLMVHPDYRRRGIGQALLETRLQRLAELGYPLVTTMILASNQASLGNVGKQGFEVFDRFDFWESPLPLGQKLPPMADGIVSRPIQHTDVPVFKEVEAQTATPLCLQVQGTQAPNYFLGWGDRLMDRFAKSQRWTRTFVREEKIIGFLVAATSSGQTKGSLSRPLVAEENLTCLPAMLTEAAGWLMQLGKTAVRIAVPSEREQLAAQLENDGWVKTQSWVRLVKWLQ